MPNPSTFSRLVSHVVRGLVCVMLASLAACESVPVTTPYPAYDPAAHPLSDTAIFQAWDGQRETELRVEEVDGQPRGCASRHAIGNHACPFWVRIAPGAHTFLIHVYYDLRGNTYTRAADVPVEVPDVRAMHTYLLDFDPRRGTPPVVHDLGARADHPMKMCLAMQGCSTISPKFE